MKSAPDVQAILNCLTDPAILLSRDYHILLANRAYEKLYGDGQTLRRRHCYEVSHRYTVPCDLAGEDCPLKRCVETGQTARVLHVHHTPRGQEYVNVETWPVKDNDDEIMYFIEIMRPSSIATIASNGKGFIGKSRSFQRMLDQIDRVAPTDTTVLLLGESGTGKEIAAQTIHARSQRSSGPFVPVECSGLPESLFESELFGHMKGAFTGASQEKPGLVEAADGGTLFLDEVGDIPLSGQVKLLRLLETRSFRRVGSTETRTANFRLLCATNKPLDQMVSEGKFREDLYFRLNVFEVLLPTLRERRDDLPLLIDHLLQRLQRDRDVTLSAEALHCLQYYPFPGNVRELRNIIERALLMCDGNTILPEHLPEKCCATSSQHIAGAQDEVQKLDVVERDYLRRALALHKGDRSSLASKLGISERVLYRKIAELKNGEKNSLNSDGPEC
ncbi:MAG: sigma-54 interaction domain-containing protein [Pseudomonadales bacterium]